MRHSHKNRSITGALLIAASLTQAGRLLAATTVPGTSDLWLAGMPNGTTASLDVAPNQSPVLLTEITVVPGTAYSLSATGAVRNGPDPLVFAGPDGGEPIIHEFGAENGIAVLTAPINSLIGVFLGPSQPDSSPPPSGLDFTTVASRNYAVISPDLQQPFFIGDGFTDSNTVQSIIAPASATRLFLGTQDGSGWYNNEGRFQIVIVPEPATRFVLAVCSTALLLSARQRSTSAHHSSCRRRE